MDINSLIIPVVIVLLILALLVTLAVSYKKPSTNEAMVVTGLGLKESRIVIGRGVFVIPIFQDFKRQGLDAFIIPVSVENANTLTQVPLYIEGNATLNIGSDDTLVRAASQKLLGKSDEERDEILSGVIKGSVRGILGKMNAEDVPNKKKIFQQNVMEDVTGDLAEFGIEIRSIQITNVFDKMGFIESLYAEDVANRKAEAEIKQAEADARSRKAVAQQKQLALQAEQESERKIAEQVKETEVLTAGYKADQDKAKAVADQAYKLSEAEASKKVIETEGQAKTVKAEQDAIIAKQNVVVAENDFKASVITKSDADAQARVLTAEADAKVINLQAKADADKITVLGKAEADKISAVGLANAEAQEKLAKALANGGDRVLVQDIIQKLPEISQAYADAIKSIDKVTIVGGANEVNGDSMTGMIDGGMAKMFETIRSTTGVDMAEITKQRGEGRVTLAGEPLVKVGGDVKIKSPKTEKPTDETPKD